MSRSATYPARARGRGRRILLEFFGATDAAGGIGVDGGGRAMPELGQDRRRRPRIGWGARIEAAAPRWEIQAELSSPDSPWAQMRFRRFSLSGWFGRSRHRFLLDFCFFFCFYRFSVFSQFTHFFAFCFWPRILFPYFPLVRIFSRSILIPLIFSFYTFEYSTLFQIWNVLMFYFYRILIFFPQHSICIVFWFFFLFWFILFSFFLENIIMSFVCNWNYFVAVLDNKQGCCARQ